MKKKILAIVASVLVLSGAGVYAAGNSGSAAVKSAPTSTAVTVRNSKADVSFGCAAKNAAAEKAKASVSSCPASKTAAVAKKQASACSSARKASSKASSSKTYAASAADKTLLQAENLCARNTRKSGCANAQTLCPTSTGNGGCNAGYNCYQKLLNSLNSKSCGQSKPASSTPAPANSSASKPSSSASAGSTSGSYSSFQNQVVQLVNQERTSRGLKALTVDSALNSTATLKSQDMAKLGYFDHTSPTYGSPFDMMKKFGISYRTAGENIAYGQTSPSQVMQGWMNSEGHRANILNSSYTKIGVGIAQNASGRYYWTQQFIG